LSAAHRAIELHAKASVGHISNLLRKEHGILQNENAEEEDYFFGVF